MMSIRDWPHEQRLRLYCSQANQYAVIIFDAEGCITDWSSGAEALTGWPAEDARGKPNAIIFTPEDQAAGVPQKELEQARRYGEASDIRWHMRRDGSRFFVDGILSAIRDADGKLVGFGKILRDLTERKQQSDFSDKQASLLDLSYDPALSWEFDTDRILYWNKGAEELYGYTEAEAIGNTPHRLLATTFPESLEAIKDCLRRTGRWKGELVHTTKHGQQLHVDSRMVLRTDLGERPIILEANRDVTQARLAEVEREASEQRFRSLVLATSQVVWQTEPDGSLRVDSPSWREFTGQSLEEEKGFGWLNAIHPEDKPAIAAAWAEAVRFQKPYAVLQRTKRADGQYRWTQVRAVPICNPDGSVREWVGAVVDITEQKLAEERVRESVERLKLATDAAKLGIWTWDADNDRATWENDQMHRIFGVASDAEPMTSVDFFKHCIYPDDVPTVQRAVTATLETDERLHFVARFYRRCDGELCWLEATGLLHPRTDSEPARIIGTLADITERKQAEENLQQLAADLAAANRRQGDFLATLAHELRNPLAPIKTGLDLMRISAENPSAIAKTRTMMERQVDHLVHLVNDLMDLARINSGKIELKVERVLLKDVVLSAVETSLPAIHAKHHHFAIDVPDEPVWIDADPNRLAQVIGNLLNNAAKYTPDGGNLSLTAHRLNNEVEIAISDNGIGIPEDALPKVFDMFTQVRQGLRYAQGGLGIGLNLVKRLTEKHGGTVTATSAGADKGSTFTIRLPVAARKAERLAEEGQPQSAATPEAAAFRILVVDDNKDAADLLRHLLEAMGHTVQVAGSGEEALGMVRQFHPELGLLDIGMPGMSGYELARELRKLSQLRHTRLAALTGWGAQEDREKSREAGFDFHLTKPVDYNTLNSLITKMTR